MWPYRVSFQEFYCRAARWKHISQHPNVLPFLGVSVSEEAPPFGLITPWMPEGNIIEYTRKHQDADRLLLVRPLGTYRSTRADIASGSWKVL